MAAGRPSTTLRPRAALAAAGLLLLAACAGDAPPPPCPPARVVPEAARVVAFRGEGRDLTDVRFEARIQSLEMTCDYEADDAEIEANLRVVLAAERGPANTSGRARLTYFVAVATREQQILAREAFDLAVPLQGGQGRAAVAEELTPRLPLGEGRRAEDYVVFVGFALSREQLDYNRRNALAP